MSKIRKAGFYWTNHVFVFFTIIILFACKKNGEIIPVNNNNTAIEFIDFTINGTPYSHIYGSDSLHHIVANNGPTLYDLGTGFHPGTNMQTSLSYLHENINAGDLKPLYNFYSSVLGGPVTIQNPPIMIHFTEFGQIGQFISGNFNGSFRGGPPNNTLYTINCSFRLRRH